MAARVVDASGVCALLSGEPDGPAERLRDGGLIAPALLPFEVANVCLKKMLDRMEIGVVEVDHGEALDLAERSGLTADDASYLWLARRMSIELVTLDRQLASALTTD